MRGYSSIIWKNWCFYVFANKKYAFLRRKQKVRIFVENFPNKNGYFCLEDRISYDRKRKGEKRCGNGQKRHFIVRTKPTVQWFTGFVCFT